MEWRYENEKVKNQIIGIHHDKHRKKVEAL